MRLGLFFRCSRCGHVSRNRPRDGWTHVMISIGSKTDHYMYGHLAVDYTSPVKIVIINEVSTVALESESIISSEITPVIKEFSIVSPVTAAAILAAAVTTATRLFPYRALLPTPPFSPPLAAVLFFSLLSLPTLVTSSFSTADTGHFLFCFAASLVFPCR